MKKRLARLTMLQELASRKEAVEADKLREMKRHQQNLQAQYAQLVDYKAGYLVSVPVCGQAASPVLMQDYHRFVSRLTGAIGTLAQQLAAYEKDVQAQVQCWHTVRAKREAFDRLVHQAHEKLIAHQDKLEQKATDDLSTSVYARRPL